MIKFFLPFVMCIVAPWLFQYIWNITMPELFALKKISYWQAFRILVLFALAFGIQASFATVLAHLAQGLDWIIGSLLHYLSFA